MNNFLRDIHYSVRMILKNPAFTVVAIFALALGIGANTAIFSVVNAVLLRPLQYHNSENIIVIQELNKEGNRVQVTAPNFLDWREQNTSYKHLAAIFTRTANLAGTAEAERINLAVTSANFFDVFSLQAERGRLFIPDDEKAGHLSIAVISNGLWHRRFGGDAEIVGKSITLDGRSYTVVGVAPTGFQYPDKTDAWLPPANRVPLINEQMDLAQIRGFGFLSTVGLLKDGVTLEQAKAEMETITGRLRQQYPETNNRRFNKVVSLHENLVGDTSKLLVLLLGAVCFLLLIACANVANLMLARSTARQKEIAIRTALGATRFQIVRQLLIESTMLAIVGGVFGLVLAWWGVDWMTRLLPKDFPRIEDIQLNFAMLGFTFAVSVITGIIFGLAPALQISKVDVQDSLKENTRGAAGSLRHNRLRSLLVIAEVALSLALLMGGGLLFRSFLRLQSVNAGFNPQQVLTVRLNPSGTNFTEDAHYVNFYKNVLQRIASIPGVDSVGAINTLPLAKGPTSGFRVEGRPLLPRDQWFPVNFRGVTQDYFRTLNIPVFQGRVFNERDNASKPLVILINQATADRDFAGENPVGKRINMGGVDRNNQPIWYEIVGVVGNVRSDELKEEPTPEIYMSVAQDPFVGMSLVIRTSIEPASLSAAVRYAVREVDAAQPVSDIRTMENIVSESVTQPRFNLVLLAIFGSIALILSTAGIYGVISYTVTQRTHEIGIRMALGAKSGDVLKIVIGQGMRLVIIGIVIGLIGSFLLTRLMSSLLFGVSATDSVTFISVSLLLISVALAACVIPARRAAKTDPMIALRYE